MTGPDVCLPQGRREWPERLSVGMLGSDEVRAYRAEGTCRLDYDAVHEDYECSACGAWLATGTYLAQDAGDRCHDMPFFFCPHCGARVEGVEW